MEYNNVKPKSVMEAKRWNYYNSDKWDFIPIRFWPRSIATAVITGKLNYVSTFEWFLYLIGNGMNPETASTVIGKETGFKRDRMEQLMNIKRDIIEKKKEWTYWDETSRKREYVYIVGVGNAKKGNSIIAGRKRPNGNAIIEMWKNGYEWDEYYNEWRYSHTPWNEEIELQPHTELTEDEMDEALNPFLTVDDEMAEFSE